MKKIPSIPAIGIIAIFALLVGTVVVLVGLQIRSSIKIAPSDYVSEKSAKEILKSWKYRKPISIKMGGQTDFKNFLVSLEIDTKSLIRKEKLEPDCDDVRFYDTESDSLLSYWIESGCNTKNTKIWVKIPSAKEYSYNIINMYYGNSDASSKGDRTSTTNLILGESFITNKSFSADCVIGSKNIHCVYLEDNEVVISRSSDGGRNWSFEKMPTSKKEGYEQGNPIMVIDSKDNIHVVWAGKGWGETPLYKKIIYTIKTKEGWIDPEIIDGESYDRSNPVMAIDSKDNIHVVWTRYEQGDETGVFKNRLLYKEKELESWKAITEIGGEYSSYPKQADIAVDNRDNLHVVWVDKAPYYAEEAWYKEEPMDNIFYRKKDFKNNWQEIEMVSKYRYPQSNPSIATDNYSDAHIVWQGKELYYNNIYYRKKRSSGSWQNYEKIYSFGKTWNYGTINYSQNPSISVDEKGVLHVFWEKFDDVSSCKILYSREKEYGKLGTNIWNDPEELDAICVSRENVSLDFITKTSMNPNLIWSVWPRINGVKTNLPKQGYILSYYKQDDSEEDNGLRLYFSYNSVYGGINVGMVRVGEEIAVEEEESEWVVYRNEDYEFEISYPTNRVLSEPSKDESIIKFVYINEDPCLDIEDVWVEFRVGQDSFCETNQILTDDSREMKEIISKDITDFGWPEKKEFNNNIFWRDVFIEMVQYDYAYKNINEYIYKTLHNGKCYKAVLHILSSFNDCLSYEFSEQDEESHPHNLIKNEIFFPMLSTFRFTD